MTQSPAVRVRFAPSPTGYLHIGGLRSAYFNWLFARHHGGTFLLRIEDTDRERSKQEYTDAIFQTLNWVQLEPDEPVVIQSSRLAEHQALVLALIKAGRAYRCYCTEQDLIARHPNEPFLKYDGFCRERTDGPDKPYAVRFKLPKDQKEVVVEDLIRGTVTFDLDQFDDFIIERSDRNPMYNFVVVADDAYMKITHVIRGEEHLQNTPKQLLLYQAFGFKEPQFAHVPLILGPSGDKLSKRDAATDVRDYRKKGYLPDALLNYLVRLGWAHGDQELFTRQELIGLFTLAGIGKKGAIFDPQKLDWVNAVTIRERSNTDLLSYLVEEIDSNLTTTLAPWNEQIILDAIGLFKDRVSTLEKLRDDLVLLSRGPLVYESGDRAAVASEQSRTLINRVILCLERIDDWNEVTVKKGLQNVAQELGVTFVQVAQPIRIALLGRSSGPGVFSMLAIVGKQDAVDRIRRLHDTL